MQQDKRAKLAVEDEPTEEAIADWRALDARMPDVAVQAYIEQMNEVLRGVNLRASLVTGQESLATDMTSSTLKGLDPSGKEKVVRFLARAGLLPVIPINYTDLRGTDLSGANLSRANLSSDNLSGANLSGAILEGNDFRGADLLTAKVTEDQLEQAESLAGATMPAGTLHP